MADKFLIAPFKSGLMKDLPVWQEPKDAFSTLNNAYVYRGVIKKRFGSNYTNSTTDQLKSRLRISLKQKIALSGAGVGITDATGAATGTAPGGVYAVGQSFSIGTQVYYVTVTGTPADLSKSGVTTTATYNTTTGVYIFAGAPVLTQIYFYTTTDVATDINGDATGIVPGYIFEPGQIFSVGTQIFTVKATGLMLQSGGAGTGTFNTTTGEFEFADLTDNPTTQIYFYPAQPVMGLSMYEAGTANDHTALAYDTQFIYKSLGTSWVRIGNAMLHGANTDYYWTANWDGITPNSTAVFFTNFNTSTPDPIYVSSDLITWDIFKPKFLGTGTADQNIVKTARIILPFKNRLILLNTYEYTDTGGGYTYKSFTNRCRYSHNGSPFESGVSGGHPWLQRNQTYAVGAVNYRYDGSGYIDAPIEEDIVSAAFIKDRLIVYFERSTFELAYTGNEIIPFVWQRLNSELGSESTFSSVAFDDMVLNVGTTGIHSCNGLAVTRIDEKIPDEIHEFLNISSAIKRVHGIRDYYSEVVYWTLPNSENDDTNHYPDKILVYNYKLGSWATFDDTVTCWGYYEQTADISWADLTMLWPDANFKWDSYQTNANHRTVIAGNQQGYVFEINSELNSNAQVLQITDVDTAINLNRLYVPQHNLKTDEFIRIHDIAGITLDPSGDANLIYKISKVDDNYIDLDMSFYSVNLTGTYIGGGTIERVSKINIETIALNPYISNGAGVAISKVVFAVVKTDEGEITVNFKPSLSNIDAKQDAINSGAIVGNYKLETYPYALIPLEATQSLLWHSVYISACGESIKLSLYFDDTQMIDKEIMGSTIEIQGILLETNPYGTF